ncbi:MAG: AraC family transcriptional regulator [Pedobacter sp.]|uniref:helix-turn-helix domain-containing protein n=1 Tax=Pedobacter sp. TaxID=1411316 RepID=UPI001212DA07|nr:MAG: AraC family transcriptional regulator [Pedobacter sp.]
MILDHKTYELFGKPILQRLKIKAPFSFDFPITDHACFLYMIDGDMKYKYSDRQAILPQKHSLFLNCIHSSKTISSLQPGETKEIMVINFHPDILKQIYSREVPVLLQNLNVPISNQSIEHINSDILIEKYIDGLLFYFQHPTLVNDDILVLKLKEIILLLSQSANAPAVQTIFNQLFSPITYTFKKIIEANIFSQFNIDELAAQHNLSISSFKREFFKNYNDTPANYIKNKRVQKAAELLIVSSQRIKEIAFQCGFNDVANFNKSFKEKYNISPSVYRQSQK